MPRNLSSNSLRLLSSAGANVLTYGYLLTTLPPGSLALDLFSADSLIGQKYITLDAEDSELRGLTREQLASRVVRVTDWGWQYLRSQGLEVKAGPGEGDGPSETRFPPDLPPVVSQHLHEIQVNPNKGRIFRLSEVMATLRHLHPHYNLQMYPKYKGKIFNILEIYRR